MDELKSMQLVMELQEELDNCKNLIKAICKSRNGKLSAITVSDKNIEELYSKIKF